MKAHPYPSSLPVIAYRLVSVLLLLAIFTSALPVHPAQAASASDCAVTHRVRSGQTLRKIAAKYKVSIKQLSEANGVASNEDLRTGMLLCIPGQAGTAPTFTATVIETNRGYRLTINGSNFSKNQLYYVRLAGSYFISTKIARIRADKEGKLSGQFYVKKGAPILDDLYWSSHMRVCLKDTRTDNLLCQTIRVP